MKANPIADSAMKGGIDFNSNKMNLETKMDSRVRGNDNGGGNGNGIQFHIDPAWDGKEIRFEIAMADIDLIVQSIQDITLRLDKGTIEPPTQKKYSPPRVAVFPVSLKVANGPYTIRGAAKDDQTVRDLFIFVGENKAYYQANVTTSSGLPFTTPIPLEDGNNIVVITARDNDNLVGSEFLVIKKDPTMRPVQ